MTTCHPQARQEEVIVDTKRRRLWRLGATFTFPVTLGGTPVYGEVEVLEDTDWDCICDERVSLVEQALNALNALGIEVEFDPDGGETFLEGAPDVAHHDNA